MIRVTPDPDAATTTIDLQENPLDPPPLEYDPAEATPAFEIAPLSLTNDIISSYVLINPDEKKPHSWKQSDLTAMAKVQNWPLQSLTSNIVARSVKPAAILNPIEFNAPVTGGSGTVTAQAQPGVFVMRQRAALFGHNAPAYHTLPAETKDLSTHNWDNPKFTITNDPPPPPPQTSSPMSTLAVTPRSTTVTHLSRSSDDHSVYLDTTYPAIVKNSWVVLESPSSQQAYAVAATHETSRADYVLSAKVTRLTVDRTNCLGNFTLRDTTVLAASEELELALLPIVDPIEGATIDLDGPYLELEVGRRMIVTGVADDLDGVEHSEVMTIAELRFIDGYTEVTFTESLANSYLRHTVSINANVVEATHGQTKAEVLGSGDATKTFQEFTLRQPPLTHVPAATASGAASTLSVFVNDILWHEVATLFEAGPDDRVYVTRLDDEGNTTVRFGDGRMGARLPTGQENVTAVYRKGIGLDGLVEPGQITLLPIRPLGVRSVVNPAAPSGAEDRESRDTARENAPLTVLTLDRIVSLRDYEDFARAFAGIAKALATWTWHGHHRGVYITVAGPDGAAIGSDSTTLTNLKDAIAQAGDPHVVVEIGSYTSIPFQLTAHLRVDPDYQADLVTAEVERVLREAFSFDRRRFGQPVFHSEVVSLIQAVEGVSATTVGGLFRTGDGALANPSLIAATPVTGTRAQASPAELLLLDPRPLSLGVLT